MDKKRSALLYYTPAIGWGILIWYFSLMPSKELPGFMLNAQDILLHFLIYAFFSALLLFGANRYKARPTSSLIVSAILVGGFGMGLGIEYLQEALIEGRHFEWGDVFFNALGCAVVWPLNHVLGRK